MELNIDRFKAYQATIESELGEAVTIDGVGTDLFIFQRQNGHRHSTDDAATAWYAAQNAPNAKQILDLGSGIGSVGLGTLALIKSTTHLTCIEAQEISFKLLRANIACNNLSDKVITINGDLRELKTEKRFDLITGSPPYFPIGTGALPPDSQKAYARFELRGDVSDYARAAQEHLTPDGIFVFCFPFRQKSRCLDLISQTKLKIFKIRDVVPHAGKLALFSLYATSLDQKRDLVVEAPLVIADLTLKYSSDMQEIQKVRGFAR